LGEGIDNGNVFALYALVGALLLLTPGQLVAQDSAAVPSLRGSASAGFTMGTLGYRLGTLEITSEVEPQSFVGARLLIGSRPELLCSSPDLDPKCSERSGFAALLGGLQFVPLSFVAEPYLGVQGGVYRFDGPVSVSSGLMAAAQVGLRLRLGGLGGVYGDASYLLARGGGFPIAGVGLYLSIPSPFGD